MKNSRRQFMTASMLIPSLSLAALASPPNGPSTKKRHIVCVGGHPDDPESGCGGTLGLLAMAGHKISILYLTRGEAGIEGKSHEEASTIRTAEAEAACRVLGAEPFFLGQIDGSTVVTKAWAEQLAQFLRTNPPDILLTHWPIDTHPDHVAASVLTLQAWLALQRPCLMYYYEVCLGEQTMNFHPTDFVDISKTVELKRRAVFCHVSQDPLGIYACGHSEMEKFRGREAGVSAAEAFVKVTGAGGLV